MNDTSGPTPAPRPATTETASTGAAATDGSSTPTPERASADVATMPFDTALEELRAVVGRLEEGGLPLEASIELYERGVALHDHCSNLLDSAELRVQRLVDGAAGAPRLMDLLPDEGEDR